MTAITWKLELLGKNFSDDYVQQFNSSTNFIIHPKDDLVTVSPPTTVQSDVAPTTNELMAALLKQLFTSFSEDHLRKIVVTLHSEIPNSLYSALTQISEIAKFDLLSVIPNWTAALMAYDLDKIPEKYYLVYDLSEHFLKIYLVLVNEGGRAELRQFERIESGTSFVDRKIVQKYNKEILLLEGQITEEITKKWMKTADQLKKILVFQENVNLVLGESGGICLSRNEYIEILKECNLTNTIHEILQKESIDKSRINNVVLCGGGCHMFHVKQIINDYFGEEKVLGSLDPTYVVAFGAATLAARMAENQSLTTKPDV